MRLPLLLSLFVLSGLAAGSEQAYGQVPMGRNQPPPPPSESYQLLQSPAQARMARLITVQPTIPVGPDGAIRAEPDTATRHLYARHKVRAVMKVRINRRGEVEDTLEYQTVDRQGRWQQVGTGPASVQRQWAYNQNGHCTSLVEYPSPNRPYTVVTTYNPALEQGQQEVLQANGQHNVVSEKRLYHSGDTLLTEIKARALRVQQYQYPQYHQRSIRLVPHPDTVLSLTCFYDQSQQPTSYQVNYLLYRHGRLRESGKLNLATMARARSIGLPTDQPGVMSCAQMLATLRAGYGLEPERRHYYDAQHRLIRQEITSPVGTTGQTVQTIVYYTYNNLGQLLGRQERLSVPMAAPRTTYTVYSYFPQGLLSGETTNVQGAKAVFYRYFYLYYQ
ncbi:hypothetical protein [Hymenobacter lucidus]|uniref:YD repeat-containing protein n=1 Tax=Hymenobacter lucidus TaxID=2880930 RepID=A0ABS8ANC0_9BACT|nr:hypothetical protein [Hymenobacter lucidus]MCB2407148.1 hypothetical protein [Hymenobacter lucidus]